MEQQRSSLRNPNRPPVHPGALLREDVQRALEMSLQEFAPYLGVPQAEIAGVLEEKQPVTPELALRIGQAVGNGPEIWLPGCSKPMTCGTQNACSTPAPCACCLGWKRHSRHEVC
jgi:addiction module HigA family antidote